MKTLRGKAFPDLVEHWLRRLDRSVASLLARLFQQRNAIVELDLSLPGQRLFESMPYRAYVGACSSFVGSGFVSWLVSRRDRAKEFDQRECFRLSVVLSILQGNKQ